jgi:hypothetical protein
MDQVLPSDRLKGSRRWPWIVGGVIGLAIAVSAFAIGPALRAGTNPPTPTATAAPADTQPTLTPDELASVQQGADEQQAIIAADAAAAKAARDAAAAKAARDAAAKQAAQQNTTSTRHPSGTPLPFYPSSDPQNANGGDYADPGTYCESGSASTINGVPTCD